MKKFLLAFILFAYTGLHAQELAKKVPENSLYALCINGKNLNDKVAFKTIHELPWMKEFLEKEMQFIPKDFDQTGIDLTDKQYMYFINRDSVGNLVSLIPLKNAKLFEKMVQAKYADTLKVKQQNNYNSAEISKGINLAWNEKLAVLIKSSYYIPYKSNYESDPYGNLEMMDTTAVIVDSVTPIYEAPVYEPVEEIKPTPDPTKKEKAKKEPTKKGKKTKKIKEEPKIVEPTEEEIYAAQEKANAELEETNRKLEELIFRKNDSIEKSKINPVAQLIFQESFGSNAVKTNSTIFKNQDAKSDFYVYGDLDLMTSTFIAAFLKPDKILTEIYKNGLLNSNLAMNGFFEKDKIRVNQLLIPKSEKTKKDYQAICDSKIDKNILNYVGDNVLGYYSIAINSEAAIHYEYSILKNTFNSVYKTIDKEATGNEIDILIDGIALLLDEKAIADLIPGNALFVLHDIKKVQKQYTSITYDDNYEQIETLKNKEEIQPDFSFYINTRNENFFNKLLQLPLNKKKITAVDYQMNNGYYTLSLGKEDIIEQVYLGLKNGVLLLTTSKTNIDNLINQKTMPIESGFKNAISKNNSAAWLDLPKIIAKSQTKEEANKTQETLLKNTGLLAFTSKFKNGAIVSDMHYSINGNHTNSLQYFFDLINDFYKQKEEIVIEVQDEIKEVPDTK